MKILKIKRANELKNLGYTQIASVVKTHYNTSYHNVHSIDEVLANDGKWIPCIKGNYYSVGINGNHIDWTITCKTDML